MVDIIVLIVNRQIADLELMAGSRADAAGKGRHAVALGLSRDWLKAQAPTATQGFALGADKFAKMLHATELVDIPLDQLKAGMTITIEPMLNVGRKEIKEMGDGWTIVTKDHSLSAQWEHTVLVTETGYEILTQSAGTPPMPEGIGA